MDEATLMSAVGEETAGILRSARSAAAEITAKAETTASAIVTAAEADAKAIVTAAERTAAELLAQAESLLASRTAEADAAATEIRDSAQAEADQLLAEGQQQASLLAEEAAQRHDDMVSTAQALRERILSDLARRRKLATVQIDQLRAGRERLLDAYLVVRRTLGEVLDELQRVDAEARAAAGAVGRQHDSEAAEFLDLRADEAWESLGGAADGRDAGAARLPGSDPGPGPAESVAAPAVIMPHAPQMTAGPGEKPQREQVDKPEDPAETSRPIAAIHPLAGPKATVTSMSSVRVLGAVAPPVLGAARLGNPAPGGSGLGGGGRHPGAFGGTAGGAQTPFNLVPAPNAGRPSGKTGNPERDGEEPPRGRPDDVEAIVTQSDAIESVRVLRQETGQAGAGSQALPSPGHAAPVAPNGTAGDKDTPPKGQQRRREDSAGRDGFRDRGDGDHISGDHISGDDNRGDVGSEDVGSDHIGSDHIGDHVDSAPRDVQNLFARIRASRAEATSMARKALYVNGRAEDTQAGSSDATARAGSAAVGAISDGGPNMPPEPTREEASGVPDAEVAIATNAGSTEAGSAEAGSAEAGEADVGASTQAAEHPGTGESSGEQEFFSRRNQVTAHLESSLARKLKRALQDEQNSLLDRLRSLKGAATPASVLPNAEEHPDRFMDAGRSLLEEAAMAGGQSLVAFYPATLAPPALGPEAIDDLVEELGKAIAEPLRQRLELAFRSPDEDHAELADLLGSAYREWKTQRIEEAAHDQVAAAFARGAYLALPEGAILRWVVDPSAGSCPDCEDNALAGEQRRGEVWPTGRLHPPAHPGCHCALAPVHQPASPAPGATDNSARA
jgi:vacuolar-type H+-ATPase subunit H